MPANRATSSGFPFGFSGSFRSTSGLMNKGMSSRRAPGIDLAADIDHARGPSRIVVGQLVLTHRTSTRIESPCSHDSRSASATKNAFARATVNTSPDPCHFNGVTVSPWSQSVAGRNRVKPVLCRNGFASRARVKRMSGSRIPASRFNASRANNSKVTIVDAGLPGRPRISPVPDRTPLVGLAGS